MVGDANPAIHHLPTVPSRPAGPMLVVVPLSTIGSWERELSKWSPGLEVLAYNGDQESRAVIRR